MPRGAQHRLGLPNRPKRPSSWNISRTGRPSRAWRSTSRRSVGRSFFKGRLGRNVCLGVPRARDDLAPAVAIEQPVDGARSHRLAYALLVGAAHLCHLQHAAGAGLPDEGGKQLSLVLGREVLVIAPALGLEIEDGLALASEARVNVVHRVVAQPSTLAISAAELPSVARSRTHWMRWYSGRPRAFFSRSARQLMVRRSGSIKVFIRFSYQHRMKIIINSIDG